MSTQETQVDSFLPDFNSQSAKTYRKWRNVKDVTTRYLMAFGGVSVIIAIVLIAFYLLYVVIPMFKSAEIESIATYSIPGGSDSNTLVYAMEEQREIGLRIDDQGKVVFFNTANGEIKKNIDLPIPAGVSITAVSQGDNVERMIGLGLSDGSMVFFQHYYNISYPNDERLITPEIIFPFGEDPLVIMPAGEPIQHLSVQYDSEQATIAAHDASAKIVIVNLFKEESMLNRG